MTAWGGDYRSATFVPMTLVMQIPPLYVLGILVAGLLLVLYVMRRRSRLGRRTPKFSSTSLRCFRDERRLQLIRGTT